MGTQPEVPDRVSPVLFRLGQIVITPAAAAVLIRTGQSAMDLVMRHAQGDYGNICDHDRRENDAAVLGDDAQIMSSYGRPPERLWVITEADHSVTTLLCPEDY